MADSIYVLGDEDRKKFAKLIAQAWSDESVKDRYESDPRAVLGEFGITYPDGDGVKHSHRTKSAHVAAGVFRQ